MKLHLQLLYECTKLRKNNNSPNRYYYTLSHFIPLKGGYCNTVMEMKEMTDCIKGKIRDN